jgi:hypothetical protein
LVYEKIISYVDFFDYSRNALIYEIVKRGIRLVSKVNKLTMAIRRISDLPSLSAAVNEATADKCLVEVSYPTDQNSN